MSHTPGPWKIKAVYIAQSDKQALHFGEYRFPHQAVDGHSRVYPREEAEANARLIAAAPELLEALRDLTCAYINRVQLTAGDEILKVEIEQALTTIAKATEEKS